MFFIRILKKENRRSGKDRRKSSDSPHRHPEKRKESDRRSGKDRRSDKDRRSSSYYNLSDDQKSTLDDIIAILEKQDKDE
jgi:hypothetical protein